MSQERVNSRTEYKEDEAVETEIPTVEPSVDLSDIDKLMAEIDDVLEENAEEYVDNFRQQGGQ